MKIEHYTAPIDLGLPYDGIYYFPSKIDEHLNDIVKSETQEWRCPFEIYEMYSFKFKYKFRYVEEDVLAKLYNNSEENIKNEYKSLLLKKMIGNENGGVFIIKLFSHDTDTTPEYLTCTIEQNNIEELSDILKSFSFKAANENFIRLTGMTYSDYEKISEAFLPRSTEYMYGSNSFKTNSFNGKIRNKLDKAIAELTSDNIDELKKNLLQMISDIDDGHKLLRRCKMVVKYDPDTMHPEIFVQTYKDIETCCEFERGSLCKALYILFLRHNSIEFMELSKYHNELLQIYRKFTKTASEDEMEKSIENLESKEGFRQNRHAIKSTFQNIFGAAIADEYCIRNENKKDPYFKITLDRGLVDLGEFALE